MTIFLKVWRHVLLDPLPLSQTVTLSRTPFPPLDRDVLYGRPLNKKANLVRQRVMRYSYHSRLQLDYNYTTEHLSRFNKKQTLYESALSCILIIVGYNWVTCRWNFSFDLIWATDVHLQTETGRLFISLGPETDKACTITPNVRFMQSMVKYLRVDERSPLELEVKAYHGLGLTMDYTYDGEVQEWIWYMRREIFKAGASSTCIVWCINASWTN